MKTTGIQPAIGVGISALFLVLAVALEQWPCGTLLDTCLNSFSKDAYKIVGGLLVSSIVVNLLAFAIVLLNCLRSTAWTGPLELALIWLGGILAIAGVAYYYANVDKTYSPMLAVIGMSFALAVAINLSVGMVTVHRG
nr:unnamed protein product [Spirometra erinaceieuropaei]